MGSFSTAINCMDGRAQMPVFKYMQNKFSVDFVDTITEAGAVKFIADNMDQPTVNKGDTVKLTITSTDVKHGITIPYFNVEEDLNPNEETVVEFTADKTGEFSFFCQIFCGSGHKEMVGTLIVK